MFTFGPFSAMPMGDWEEILVQYFPPVIAEYETFGVSRAYFERNRDTATPEEQAEFVHATLGYERQYDMSMEIDLNDKQGRFLILDTRTRRYDPVKYSRTFNTQFTYFV